MKIEFEISCHKHGSNLWSGQVVCAQSVGGCGRFWHLGEKGKQPPDEYGADCVCGCSLHADAEGCTARPVCPGCFDANTDEA